MTTSLFPLLQQKANTVSAGSEARVQGLHKTLAIALEKGQVPLKIYSIVDADAQDGHPLPDQSYAWDVYHIENYLLEPRFILKILKDLGIKEYSTEEAVYEELRDCAKETMTSLIRHQLATSVRSDLVGTINTRTDPNTSTVAPVLADAIKNSAVHFASLIRDRLDVTQLAWIPKAAKLTNKIARSLL